MVKNLPTVERSTKIRFGKNCTDDQAENTIVFNASDEQLDIPFSDSVYMTPLRLRTDLSDRKITVLAYNQVTKEVMDSGAVAEDILNFSLEAAVINGNVTGNTVSFNDAVTSVTTLSNVGVANGNPVHTLDVGSTFNVDTEGSNLLTVLGNTYMQNNLVVDGNMRVNGALTTVNTVNTIVKDPIIELGKENVSSDLGIIMYRPNANVAVGFREGPDELVFAYTDSSSYGSTINPKTSDSLDVRVYGRVLTESNVGILTTTPTHSLDVGSNLFVDEFGSNVLYVTGNTHTTDILSIGNKVGIKETDPDAELHVEGNVYVSSNLTVDENTFHVDATAHAVGIETKEPDANLHVVGNVYVSSNLTVDENTFHVDSTAHAVGIETKEPDANLHVVGNVYTSGDLTVDENTFHVDAEYNSVGVGTKEPDANLHVVGNVYVTSDLTVDENTFHVDAVNHAVGIETKSPDANLHVVGNVYVSDDLTVATNTLHVEADTERVGIKTKVPDAELHVVGNIYVASDLTVDNDTFHVDATNHAVGIETKSPDANLHVVGNVYISDDLTVATDTLHVEASTLSVGLGTKVPDAKLHVVGNVYTSGNLTVDENTFHVDAVNHSVGIETKEPDANLHVVGNVYVSDDLTVATDALHVEASTQSVGIKTKSPDAELHVVGNTYISSNLTVDENTFHVDAVNHSVGIETKTPDANLHVVGNVYVSSNLTVDTDTFHVDVANHSIGIETKSPDANLHVVGNVYVSSNLTVDTDTFHVDAETSRVGLGTKAPAYLLDVHGTSNVGALTAVSGSVANDFTVDTNTLYVDSTENRVGIKTLTPSTELHVEGNVYVSSNIQALTYFGDGGLLSNVTLQVVSDHGNTTSNTIQFTNPTTALTTDLTSNVEVKLDQLSNVSITDLAADQILVYDDSGNWVNEFPLHNYIKIRNAENGITMLAGNTVYIESFHNANVVNAKLAKADSPTTMPSIGIVYDASLAPGTEGVAVAYGKVNQMNTLAFNEGETLYVSNTYAGVLSNVKPYGTDPDLIQNIGVVTRKHENSGAIFVTGVGRANDIPNAPIVADETDINYVYVNNENNDLKKIEPANLLTQLQTFEQVSAAGNTVSNTMEFNNVTTGLVTVANVKVGSNISVVGLIDATNKHVPMVGLDGFLEKSPIYFTPGGTYVVSAAEAEFLGNLTLSGNTTILNSESVTISDRIFGVAANNSVSGLDSGFMIEHQEGDPLEYANVALIYHADEHRFSISYTQNTFTDDHILHYEDETHQMLIDLRGNVQVQNTFTVNTDTFHVDSVNERVGVLTTSPAYTLDVHGNSNVAVARSKSSVVTDATAATNKTTGAVTIVGGLGVGGDIHATDVNFEDATLDSATIQNTTAATSKTSGALIVTGGVGISGALFGSTGEFDGITKVTNSTAATTKTSGALQVTGGVGVSGDIHATHVNFEDAEVDSLTVTDTTVASSNTTGAVTIAGGLGVVGNVHAALFYGDGSQLTGLVTTLEDVANNGNTMSNTIIYENTGTSLVTDGNVGIVTRTPDANLHVVGNVHVADTTEAFSTITGAVTITGGMGVVGNVHAAQYHGDGSKLTGLVTTLEDVANNGNTMSNVIQFTNGDTGLITTGKIGVSTGDPDANLHVVGNVHVTDVATFSNGIVTNTGQYTKKTYSFTRTVSTGITPSIDINFTSNIFYAKITAQLINDDEDISTMILEVSGGKKDGSTPSRDISIGTKNIFGSVLNPNPWSSTVSTTTNRVRIDASSAIDSGDGYDIFVEYMRRASVSDGKVTSIDENTTEVIAFGY